MAEQNSNHERRRSYDIDIASLRKCIEEMKNDDVKLHAQIAELLRAWDTATGLVQFIKWLAGVATAISVLWLSFSGYWHK